MIFIGDRNEKAVKISQSAECIKGNERTGSLTRKAGLSRVAVEGCDQAAGVFQVFGTHERDISILVLPSGR